VRLGLGLGLIAYRSTAEDETENAVTLTYRLLDGGIVVEPDDESVLALREPSLKRGVGGVV
jgi:hypothetical protein